jgi:hypothetical protein
MEDIKLRMYFLVPYNLSPIQQGIQAGHACQQYAYLYGDTELFKKHSSVDMTWIILNGGTTRESDVRGNKDNSLGTMQESLIWLEENTSVNLATFYEPDLNHTLTAICFICDERVWNRELYPEMEEVSREESATVYNAKVREYISRLGGKDNASLRFFLSDKRLA